MSLSIFAAPLSIVALVSLWLGWRANVKLFCVWLALCVGTTLFIAAQLFASTSSLKEIISLALIMALFQISSFAMGYVVHRMWTQGKDR